MLYACQVMEADLTERLADFEAAREARNKKLDDRDSAIAEKVAGRAGRRVSALEARGGVGQQALDLTAAVAMSLKFVRKVRGIKAEVKAPPPKPGMENTAWARNSGTASQAANHEAAEKAGKEEVLERVWVEDVDSHGAIGGKLLGGE